MSTPRRVVVGAGALLFLTSWVSWFSAEGLRSFTAWDLPFLFGAVPVILGTTAAAFVVLGDRVDIEHLPPWPWARVVLVQTTLAALLIVVKLFAGQGDDTPLVEVSVGRSIGLFVATIAALVQAGAAYVSWVAAKSSGSGPTTG